MVPVPPDTPIDRWLRLPRVVEDRQHYLGVMMDVNCSHVVMLHEQGMLATEPAASLLTAIDRVRMEPGLLDRHSDQEDLYLMVEAAISDLAGEEAGGNLHIGRSRNDLIATMTKMVARETVVHGQRLLLDFIGSLVALARDHKWTIMPGYTHLRPGQPTTLGHYLLGIAYALQRDFERLGAARRRADECPMGAAAFAGTGFPIDRQRVASLLGFTRTMTHTQDAVASRDGILELLAGYAILSATVARFLQDWYVWSTVEFGFITLGSSIVGGSSIMPQKQNPNILERCRAKAAHAGAALVDALTVTKGTGFMHCQDISVESVMPFWQSAREVEGMLEVARHVLLSSRVNAQRLRERSTAGFTMATEVADMLVRTRGVPFRTAHSLVARVVRSIPEGDARGFSALLNKAGVDAGRRLELTEADIATWTDPEASVRARHSGGPAPGEVERLTANMTAWADTASGDLQQDRQQWNAATGAMQEAARRILSTSRHAVQLHQAHDGEGGVS